MGQRYPHVHDLTHLVAHVDTPDLELRSNLSQLDTYAGGDRYGPALDPVTDFTRMANDVTHDLEIIHERIARLTGEDPWDNTAGRNFRDCEAAMEIGLAVKRLARVL